MTQNYIPPLSNGFTIYNGKSVCRKTRLPRSPDVVLKAEIVINTVRFYHKAGLIGINNNTGATRFVLFHRFIV